MLPGIFGKERVEAEAKRLENKGNPMEESPVGVNHSAGIVDTRDWVNALRGYQYDSMNRDVLLNLATTTDDGYIQLPSGMRYRVLVLPMNPSKKEYSKEVKEKIEAFRKAGVLVIDKPYEGHDFSSFGLPRDVELPKDIAYTHRYDNGQDIYFLANQTEKKRSFHFSMRKNASTIFLYFLYINTLIGAEVDFLAFLFLLVDVIVYIASYDAEESTLYGTIFFQVGYDLVHDGCRDGKTISNIGTCL